MLDIIKLFFQKSKLSLNYEKGKFSFVINGAFALLLVFALAAFAFTYIDFTEVWK